MVGMVARLGTAKLALAISVLSGMSACIPENYWERDARYAASTPTCPPEYVHYEGVAPSAEAREWPTLRCVRQEKNNADAE